MPLEIGRYEYRVMFRRARWVSPNRRILDTELGVRRLIASFEGNTDGDEVVDLRISRRRVGDWEPVHLGNNVPEAPPDGFALAPESSLRRRTG